MKEAKEKYEFMDKKSSEESWNHDFGIMVILVLERAIRNGQNKTVKELVDEIEIDFNKS